MILPEKLADDKPVVHTKGEEEPDVTILRINEADGGENSSKERKPDGKEVVQSLVKRIPEETLERTMVRKEEEGSIQGGRRLNTWDYVKSPGRGTVQRKMLKKEICPGSVKNGMKTPRKATMINIVYA